MLENITESTTVEEEWGNIQSIINTAANESLGKNKNQMQKEVFKNLGWRSKRNN
jgi:hypothetical protein